MSFLSNSVNYQRFEANLNAGFPLKWIVAIAIGILTFLLTIIIIVICCSGGNSGQQRILLIGGLVFIENREKYANSTGVYYPTENYSPKFDLNNSLITRRRWHLAAVIGGIVYVTGGRDQSYRALSSTEILDPDTGRWKQGPQMSEKRHWPAGGVINNYWYVCAGWSTTYSDSRTCEKLNVNSNTWIPIPSMPRATHAAAGAAIDSKLYIIGGWSNHIETNAVECLDTETNRWETIESMTTKRDQLAATILNQYIIACGGEDRRGMDLNVCEKYDTKTKKWSLMADMKRRRDDFGLVNFDGKVYALGGEPPTAKDTVEYYDINIDRWQEAAKMDLKREDFAAVVL